MTDEQTRIGITSAPQRGRPGGAHFRSGQAKNLECAAKLKEAKAIVGKSWYNPDDAGRSCHWQECRSLLNIAARWGLATVAGQTLNEGYS
jgi:hypothetical protein